MSEPSAPAPKKGILKRPLLLGSFGILCLTAIAIAALLIWLFTTGKTVITDALREEIVAKIETSDLPEAQKIGLSTSIDKIVEGYQSGDISTKQMLTIVEQIAESPSMSLLRVYTAKGDPLKASDFSPEQRAEAEIIVRRFAYGVVEERIPESAVDELVDRLLLPGTDEDSLEFRSDISEQELRETLAKAKDYADRANISQTNLSPDIAARIQEIIDRIVAANE